MHEATRKMLEAEHGPDHPRVFISRNNLAQAYVAAGRLAESTKLHEATLLMQESKLGPDASRHARDSQQPGELL